MQPTSAPAPAEATNVEDEAPESVRERIERFVDMAQPSPALPPKLVYGTIASGERLAVILPEGTRPARRAKSCLVAAEAGDRVLCSTDGDAVYVLAIIEGGESTSPSKTKLATEGVLEIAAPELKVQTKTAHVTLADLKWFGRSIEATLTDKVSLAAERIESRASRLLTRAKQAFRFVDELEQVRAGNYDLRAESLAAVRGENTIVAARVLNKIDGEQVKIG